LNLHALRQRNLNRCDEPLNHGDYSTLERQEEAETDTEGRILDTRVANDEGVERDIRNALEAWASGDIPGARAALEWALKRLYAPGK
jgi:hypothetical protein